CALPILTERRGYEHGEGGGDEEVQAERGVEQIRGERADGEQFSVGEVGQARGAEDEGEADRAERDGEAEAEAFESELGDAGPVLLGLAGRGVLALLLLLLSGGDEREQYVALVSFVNLDGEGGPVGVAEGDALR